MRYNCTPECWTETECQVCHLPQAPRGRSVALIAAAGYCYSDCPGWVTVRRHLWDVHDSTRLYNDPQGWADHLNACQTCQENYS